MRENVRDLDDAHVDNLAQSIATAMRIACDELVIAVSGAPETECDMRESTTNGGLDDQR